LVNNLRLNIGLIDHVSIDYLFTNKLYLATTDLDAEFVIRRRNTGVIESASVDVEFGWKVLFSLLQTASRSSNSC